jgi:hypothetical protein
MKFIKTFVVASLFMATSAFGQSTSVAVLPTPPSPPAIVTTSPNSIEGDSLQTTNKVYIDQAGNDVNVNIDQYGTGNVIGTIEDPIYLRGDKQTLTILQTGDMNTILASVVSDLGAQGVANITLRQFGDGNSATIRCGNAETDASCNALDMNSRFTGNYNSFVFHGSGANIRNSMDIQGDNNQFNIDVTAANSTQTLKFLGDFNTVNMTQSGTGGTYGHSAWMDVTGTNNTITTEQYGASETAINLLIVGNNGLYNIKTGH